ncbi:MAG: hypothetical protein H0X64_01595 [Gemmatimonadaceae bacterium]|nr:hypothetical protein [Gemmatimonadaceae bacterium]
MSLLDATAASFVIASVVLLMLEEFDDPGVIRAQRIVRILWFVLSIGFVLKVVSVLSPIILRLLQ